MKVPDIFNAVVAEQADNGILKKGIHECINDSEYHMQQALEHFYKNSPEAKTEAINAMANLLTFLAKQEELYG